MYDILQKFQLSFDNKDVVCELIDKVVAFLSGRDAIAGGAGSLGSTGRNQYALEHFKSIIQRVFKNIEAAADMKKYYRVVVHTPAAQEAKTKDPTLRTFGRALSYWCFSPGTTMKELKNLGVRSFVLASGTLSPMDSYASELQLAFNVRLENPHVIDADQVMLAICKRGPNNVSLNSSYEQRSRESYKRELGDTITQIVRAVPDGILVFFPSYGPMHDCVTFWRTDRGGEVWRRLSALKVRLITHPIYLQQRSYLRYHAPCKYQHM
jgi:regulator of telomere elongation helicase 1